MNHDDNERELFARLEADMTGRPAADPVGDVVDIGKVRSARDVEPIGSADPVSPGSGRGSADRAPVESGDGSADLDDPGRVVLVDQPDSRSDVSGLWDRLRTARRRPIVPAWARSRSELATAAKWAAGYVGHIAAFHAVRAPLYAGKLALRAPVGAVKAIGATGRWLSDAEGKPLRAWAVREANAVEYLRLSRVRTARVRLRSVLLALGTVVGVGSALALWVLAPGWLTVASGVAVVAALGMLGAPADAPLATRAVVATEVQKLTSDMVLKAMASIGISQITTAVNKGGDGIKFPSPITRDGPGWRADIDLPLGVTVADVIDRRRRLASGLRRPLGCVWPDADPNEHEGRLVLWVGDRDLSKTGLVKWPLASAARHDVFERLPFGIDPRGRAQSVPLIQHNVLIGSLPGQGKTSSVRVLACGAALDPTVELWIHELKGTGDLDALDDCCQRFVSGLDDESIKYAADSLRALRREVERRVGAIKRLPRDLCPDKRITRRIADKRSLRLWPLVGIFDECQNLFAHPDYGKQAGEDAEFVIKLGRALGVTLVLATQRPDKDSLPTGVSGNVSIRFCLKVAGQVENDMVLGTSMYKNGVRATQFRPETDAGTGYLVGASTLPTVVRTAYLDDPATAGIAAKALALRQAAGTLTAEGVGHHADTRPGYDLLADILAVVPETEERVWNERIASRLAELRPEVYGGWKSENVTAALKPHRVKARDVAGTTDDGTRTTRRGIVRAHILTAITERDESRGAA